MFTITGEVEIKTAFEDGRSVNPRNRATCPASEYASSRRKFRLSSRLSIGT
jgi:hypothetical protein